MALPLMILGLLRDKPLSGYDVYREFHKVTRFFWSADQSQIYRTLHEMRRRGWVTVQGIKQTKNPTKKRYHITREGKHELNRWLRRPPSTAPARFAWLGRLFFAKHLSPDEYRTLLERLRDGWRDELNTLEARVLNPDLLDAARAQQRRWNALPNRRYHPRLRSETLPISGAVG
jgi:DNA-binding PadR family transcriptional regulator